MSHLIKFDDIMMSRLDEFSLTRISTLHTRNKTSYHKKCCAVPALDYTK